MTYHRKLQPKFYYINKYIGQKPFNLLDVGCGNHSASQTKSLFPNCTYQGIDLDVSYNNDAADFAAMEKFYEMDVTKLQFNEIPDNHFDFIRLCHVIEHLHNGDEVLTGLLTKLKKGGYIYLEYPGERSTKLPSMHGTLNFYDDPTHVRIYSIPELKTLFEGLNCEVKVAKTRRNLIGMLAIPVVVTKTLLRRKKLLGNTFWDILGFAEQVVVQKK